METRASYIAVGSFVLLLAASLLVFVVWLGKVSFEEATQRYLIYFTGPVTGLQEGSVVRVRGIAVGQVVDIRFDPENIGRVQVMIEVQDDTPIRADSVARLDIQGITGIPFVQISGGSAEAPPLVAVSDERYPVIPSEPSAIQAVIETTPQILERVVLLLTAAEGFMTDENQRAFGRTLANLAVATDALADQSDDIEGLIASVDGLVMELRVDAARLSDRLDQTLATVDRGAEQLTREATVAIEDVQQAADGFGEVAEQINAFLELARPSLEQFSSTGLAEFTLMVTELRDLARTLSRVSERIERDRGRFLFGTGNQGVPIQ